MKNYLYPTLLFLLVTLFFSCQEKEKSTFPVIDPKEINTVHTLKFSELVKDIRIVPLETNDNCLLGRNVTYWVGNKYILAIGPSVVHLFDSDGKHIRQLISQGRGPDEYVSFNQWIMDEQKERFYFLDFQNNSSIRFVDLKSGEKTGKIQLQSMPVSFAIVDSTIIYCPEVRIEPAYYKNFNIENNTPFERNEVFYISGKGDVVHTIPADTTLWRREDIKRMRSSKLLKDKNDLIYCSSFSDTIFRLNQGKKEPFFFVYFEKPMTITESVGKNIELEFNGQQHLFFSTKETVVESKRFLSIFHFPKVFYRFNKTDHTTCKIDRFYLDPFNWETEALSLFQNTIALNEYICYPMTASEIEQIIEQKKEAGEELTPQLKKLSQQLTEQGIEDPNPILIIGKII